MTEKEKIRAEVERLRKSYQIMYQELDCESPKLMSVCAKRNLCQDILMFIDSLQEEPVSEDLGEATNNYCVNVRKGYPRVMDETDRYIYNAFKAGAEWGKNQAMAEIQAQSMALVHGCPEEKTSKDLENAAKHYLYSNILYDDVYVGNPTEKDCIEMFKAGAKWQKEKGQKK